MRVGSRVRRALLLAVLFVLAVPGLAPAISAASRGDPAVVGEWSARIKVGTVGIHATLLRTGRYLLWGYPVDEPGSEVRLIDPVTGQNQDVSIPIQRDIFCAGLSVMPDGRVLVTGGQKYGSPGNDGTRNVTIFDPTTNRWSDGGKLAVPRWYPTNVQLPDGTTLVLTGQASDSQLQRTMESYDPGTGTWTTLPPTANSSSDLYARMFVLPDGRLFRAGPNQVGRLFDPATASWSGSYPMQYGWRSDGSAVLLPGLTTVLTAGGANSDVATPTAELIDLSAPAPRWTSTGSMNRPRKHLNLVLLPDGSVLAVGGGLRGLYDDPVKTAELYDPASGRWTMMAAQTAQRTYHSTALLLPDGRVMSAGSDSGPDQTTVEYYSPPYLFHGSRPTISSAPASLGYGESFAIETPQAPDIARVALVRPGAVTHGVDFDQRYVDLSFHMGEGSLIATAPGSPNEAPPGWYMLFVLNSKGVPSVARFVQIGSGF